MATRGSEVRTNNSYVQLLQAKIFHATMRWCSWWSQSTKNGTDYHVPYQTHESTKLCTLRGSCAPVHTYNWANNFAYALDFMFDLLPSNYWESGINSVIWKSTTPVANDMSLIHKHWLSLQLIKVKVHHQPEEGTYIYSERSYKAICQDGKTLRDAPSLTCERMKFGDYFEGGPFEVSNVVGSSTPGISMTKFWEKKLNVPFVKKSVEY